MKNEKETINRKMKGKEEELQDKIKEVETLKVALSKKDREFAKIQ